MALLQTVAARRSGKMGCLAGSCVKKSTTRQHQVVQQAVLMVAKRQV
jgi:hypothetical protein